MFINYGTVFNIDALKIYFSKLKIKIMEKVKNLSLRMFSLLLVMTMVASTTNAADNKDKVTLKARTAVQNASPEDWLTLAESAEVCFDKGVNLREASDWIDLSLSIKETSYNLEVKGDYYFASNLYEKALTHYVKSMKKGMEDQPGFDTRHIQAKIVEVRKAAQ